MKKSYTNRVFTAGVVFLFLLSAVSSGVVGVQSIPRPHASTDTNVSAQDEVVVSCVVGNKLVTKQIAGESWNNVQGLFSAVVEANAKDPCGLGTRVLKERFIQALYDLGLISRVLSVEKVCALIEPPWGQGMVSLQHGQRRILEGDNATFWFCSMAGGGYGFVLPPVLLPRPRLFMQWRGFYPDTSIVSVSEMATGRGVIARGTQIGNAYGFFGVGFAFAVPGAPAQFGFLGYSLLTTVQAADMDWYFSNFPPLVLDESPVNGALDVPTSLSELQFTLKDYDWDTMSYSVVTSPDIGSGSEANVGNGVYSIPVSGLESQTMYTWMVTVSDGTDSVVETFNFTTEAVGPIVSDVSPGDGAQEVPVTQDVVRFHLRDPQGDLMTYTVETSPDIGSGSGTGVSDGFYSVPLTGVMDGTAYTWFVNATDGTHWTRKVFRFETVYPMVFDPFEYGWQYRKQITVDHTKVGGDLVNFPVLVSITDTDLRDVAQEDGDDLLFMASDGVSVKLNHEIESYESSTGTLVAWVNLTSLSSITDTVFYLYYGNPDCLNKENIEHTWDDYYKGVYHMNDLTTSTIDDSTVNEKVGMKVASNRPIEVTGKIGDAQDFESSTSDYIAFNSPFANWATTETEVTISCWIKPESFPNFESDVYHWGADGEMEFKFKPNQTLCWGVDFTTGWVFEYSPPMENGIWYYCVGTWKKNDLSNWYINGDVVVSKPVGNLYCRDQGSQYTPFFGAYTSSQYFYDGVTDEIRISITARNASWISTEYNNQYSPETFLNLGPEESPP
jgi:hypothetical protein